MSIKIQKKLIDLEAKSIFYDKELAEHDLLIKELDDKMDILVKEVRQIRNALYIMAVTIAANVPAVSQAFKVIATLVK